MSKVLVIEDDEREGRLYKNLFTMEGFEAEIATSGEEGIQKAVSWQPHIILLDIMMPGMNGFTTFDIIKEKEEIKHIPVVMLTNLSGEENKNEALQKGATSYLVKSDVENKRLVATVRDIISVYQQKPVS